MIEKKIREVIAQALKAINLPEVTVELEHPADESHGDYSSNVAMVLFSRPEVKENFESPRDLAEKIIEEILSLPLQDENVVDKVEVAGPGFINFFLSEEFLLAELDKVLNKKDEYGRNTALKGKKVIVEYTDPNPFKEFHIGHLYSNIVGESLARLHEAGGAEVWRADYFGDVGMHVAKSLWGLRKKFAQDNLSMDQLAERPLTERVQYMGQAYAKGATAFKEDEAAQEEMKRLNFLIYLAAQKMWQEKKGWDPVIDYGEFGDFSMEEVEEVYRLYVTGREWSLDYFETIYKRLGTKFDGYYPESLAGEYGYRYVRDNMDVFEESQGAIIFPGEKYGLHTRVFINQMGLPTYEAKELGLAPFKHQEFPYESSIIVTGNEINEYFQVLLAALQEVNPELAQVTTHIGHGMVKLPEGKMSSRTGNILRGEWLIDEAAKKAREILKEQDYSEKEKEEIAEKVGQAAVKYALLKQSIGRDVIFKFEEQVSFEGNSGPYLQYTYARARSVVEKAEQEVAISVHGVKLNPEETLLSKLIYRFGEAIEMATTEHAPHVVALYLYELAQRFNTFYNKHSVLQAESEDKRQLRLALTAATAQVLKNGLQLLGIKAPEKM